MLFSVLALPIAASAFTSESVYDAVPSTLPQNMASLGYQATQTAEFGDFFHLGASNRMLNTVTVTMSNWALASTAANISFCTSNPSSCSTDAFVWPITVNVYSSHLGANGAPDTLLATKTEDVSVPWRPEADVTCTDPAQWRSSVDGQCYNGYAFNAAFDLSSLNTVLPEDVIVGVKYSTQSYGDTPTGTDGPYNSLNVGVEGSASVGTDADTDNVFWNTGYASFYTDGGAAGVGIFREDTNWSPYGTVALQVTARPFPVTNGANSYATIQEAVNAASPGDTITVDSGTYDEDITIPTGVTIAGTGTSTVSVIGQITVNAADTTITGLSISNPDGNFGILINHVDNVTVSGNSVSDVGTGTATGNVYGIYFQDSDAVNNSGVTIENNTVTNIGKGTASGNGSNGGIGIGDSTGSGVLSGFMVSGNTISDINANTTAVSPGKGAYGIIVNHAVPSASGSTTGIQITDNTISNLNGRWAHAIGLEGNTPDAIVTGNTISNATASGGDASAVHFDDNPSSASVELNHNSFDTTTVAYGVVSTLATDVDASANFWNTGTVNPTSKVATTSTGIVTVSPWFKDSGMTALSSATSTNSSGETTTTTGTSNTSLSGTSTQSGSVTVTAEIPSGTTVTGSSSWDGTIIVPTATTTTVTISGFSTTVTSAISIGSDDSDLTFDRAVKLVFTGQAGQRVGWYNHAGDFTEITDTCTDNTQTTNDGLTAGASCKIDSGADLVIWTKHFSVFVSFTATAIASSGGGSSASTVGGNGPIAVSVAPATTGSVNGGGSTGGQVLGAATYNFSANLTVGSQGEDVIALQQILIDAGLLNIPAPTGYFGPLTKAAVIAYQQQHDITPSSGFVGVKTRAVLNAGTTPTISDEERSLLLENLRKQLEALLQQLQQLLQAQTV